MNKIKNFSMFLLLILFVLGAVSQIVAQRSGNGNNELSAVEVMYGASGISFIPKISYSSVELRVSNPDGTVITKMFDSGTPYVGLSDFKNAQCLDGQYNYELKISPFSPSDLRPRSERSSEKFRDQSVLTVHSGTFRVVNGSIVSPAMNEELSRVNDVLHYDDVIITGSLCVGFDCTDGMAFNLDTIVLSENSLRIFFDDTSVSPFPLNDWRIVVNDSASGGASYFAVQDATNSKTPFKIEANARSNALYIEDGGRIGIGTSLPIMDVHISKGDSPTLRLEQDGSSGWSAQSWDVAGNETNFFIRDVTGGSKLPLRIQTGAPTNTLTMKNDGKVGLGTWAPEYNLEIESTGANPVLGLQRTDGVTAKFLVSDSQFQFGSVTNHPIKFLINGATAMTLSISSQLGIGINPIHPIHLASGAHCTAGGVWTNASSITFKENIQPLTQMEAETALCALNPVKYNYIADKEENHVGFIAEDAPELVATKDRKGMSPMDIAAVLTRVVQEQQKMIQKQGDMINELKQEMAILKDLLNNNDNK